MTIAKLMKNAGSTVLTMCFVGTAYTGVDAIASSTAASLAALGTLGVLLWLIGEGRIESAPGPDDVQEDSR
jgi:hypothetical protein